MKLSLVNLILFSSRRMPSESDKWGWKHVSVFGGFVKGSGTKRWTCNHCKGRYNGSYSRVRAHLLGFTGVGVKSCPAIDKSLREICRKLEEERVAKKRKKILGSDKIGKCIKNATINPLVPIGSISKDDVDEILARFFYADGLSMSIVQSPYFQEMAEALAAFGPGYEPPSADMLAGSFLRKEKSRIEKSLMLVRESWPHTGCTIFCVNCLDGSTGCFCINFFVSSPRGLVFLKMLDVKEGDGADNVFIDVLSQAIMDIGPTNVLQIITHLGQASSAFESVMLTKFPRIFWCHCTSHSIRVLMEEIFELDWMRAVVLCAKEIEQGVLKYQCSTRCIIPCDPNPPFDNACEKFAPSYYLVQRVLQMKQPLHELVSSDEWKHWKLTSPDDAMNIEAATLKDDFWARAKLMLQLCEPFVRSLDNIDKSVMGDVYHWRVQSLEAARTEGIDDIALNQLEMLIENRWDTLFSPLHSTGYILNPRYFGRDQNRDKTVMRGWKATLDRYEGDSSARRQLREQLSAYWRGEGCFGEEDAMECRDKMDPIAWWENFGYETPNLQRLAIKVLSQACSVSLCQDSWQCQSLPCPDSFSKLGVDKGEDLAFVRNNLRLQSQKSGNLSNLSLPRSRSSCCASGCGT